LNTFFTIYKPKIDQWSYLGKNSGKRTNKLELFEYFSFLSGYIF
jgi:hypothetical protein